MQSSAIRELLKVTQNPEIISFAGGLPAPELFPVNEVSEATQRLMQTRGQQALQYGPTEGYQPLREYIAQSMSIGNLRLTADNVLITTGSQQALYLLGLIFLDEGDTLLVDSPTYMGALQAWVTFGVKYETIPVQGEALLEVELEQSLERHPKWIYTLPNFQNPSGLSLNMMQREKLITATNRHSVPLIEDDPYGDLRFDGEPMPSMLQLAQQEHPGSQAYQGNVIYLGTFSKTISPGLRVGWVIAPPEIIAKMVQAKQGVDLQSSTYTQMLVYEMTQSGFLTHHIERIRTTYMQRRDVMLRAMQRHFPVGVSWTHPQGGMFLWVTMAPGVDTAVLLGKAIAQKVAFVPGVSFYPSGDVHNTMRLNFSNSTPEQIEEGIARLGQVFREAYETTGGSAVVV
jgi:2-aminoadipate transaminase